MDCPRCDAKLRTESLDGSRRLGGSRGPFRSNPNLTPATQHQEGMIWVERCDMCQGIWFDRGELSEAMRNMEILEVPDLPSDRRFEHQVEGACPRCKAGMAAYSSRVVPGIVFNVCKTCEGIWLDAGELRRLSDPLVALSSFLSDEFR